MLTIVDLANTGSVLAVQTADLGRARRGRLRGARPRAGRRGARLLDRRRRDARSAAGGERGGADRAPRSRGSARPAARSARSPPSACSMRSAACSRSGATRPPRRAARWRTSCRRRRASRGPSSSGASRWRSPAGRRATLRTLYERELGPPAAGAGAGPARLASGFDATAALLAGAIPSASLVTLLAPLALRSARPRAARRARPADRAAAARLPRPAGRRPRERPRGGGLRRPGRRVPRRLPRGRLRRRDRLRRDGGAAGRARRCRRAASSATGTASPSRRSAAERSRGRRCATPARASPSTSRSGTSSAVSLRCRSSWPATRAPRAPRRTRSPRRWSASRRSSRAARSAPEAAAAIAHERAEAELRAAARGRAALLAGRTWTVVAEEDAQPRPAPLHRFVRVVAVRDTSGVLAALAPCGRHLAALGAAGFGAERRGTRGGRDGATAPRASARSAGCRPLRSPGATTARACWSPSPAWPTSRTRPHCEARRSARKSRTLADALPPSDRAQASIRSRSTSALRATATAWSRHCRSFQWK